MELFIIQCTTCRARLKVNDESVIGDILACPKCGSMVQVVPPLGWSRNAVGVSTGEPTPSEPRPAPTPSRPAEAAAKAAAILPPRLPPRAAAPVETSVPSSVPTAAQKTAPSATGMAVVARIRQDWILLACGLAAGIAIGVGAWLTMRNGGTADGRVAVAPQDAKQESPPRAAPAPNARPAKAQAERPRPAALDSAESVAPTEPAEEPAVQPTAALGQAAAPQEPASDTAAEIKDVSNSQGALDARAGGIKLDPVGKHAPPPATEPEIAASAADDAASQPEPSPPTSSRQPLHSTSSVAEAGVPKLTSEQIDERLGGALPVVRFVNVPLAQFVDFISNFAGLPIAIDDAALARAGKKRQSPVTVRLKDATAREALSSAVSSLGLSCAVRDGRLVVTAADR